MGSNPRSPEREADVSEICDLCAPIKRNSRVFSVRPSAFVGAFVPIAYMVRSSLLSVQITFIVGHMELFVSYLDLHVFNFMSPHSNTMIMESCLMDTKKKKQFSTLSEDSSCYELEMPKFVRVYFQLVI